MGLNCQLTLDGWVEANLLSNLQSKLFFFMPVAFIRLFVPFNTVYGQLMQLYKYRKHLDYFDYFLKGWLIVTGGSIIFIVMVFLLQKRNIIFHIKRGLKRELKTRPYLFEPKTMVIYDRRITVKYKDYARDIAVSHLVENNKKYYLFTEDYQVIDVIPHYLFKSASEQKLFLEILNMSVEYPSKNILYRGLY